MNRSLLLVLAGAAALVVLFFFFRGSGDSSSAFGSRSKTPGPSAASTGRRSSRARGFI